MKSKLFLLILIIAGAALLSALVFLFFIRPGLPRLATSLKSPDGAYWLEIYTLPPKGAAAPASQQQASNVILELKNRIGWPLKKEYELSLSAISNITWDKDKLFFNGDRYITLPSEIREGVIRLAAASTNFDFLTDRPMSFYLNGRLRNGSLKNTERISVGGKPYDFHALTLDTNGAIQSGEIDEIDYKYDTNVFRFNYLEFAPDRSGRITAGRLVRPVELEVDKFTFSFKELVEFYPGGRIFRATLNSNFYLSVDGTHYPMTSWVSFYPDGKFLEASIEKVTMVYVNYENFPFSRVRWNTNGDVTDGDLYAEASISVDGVPFVFASNQTLRFYKTGYPIQGILSEKQTVRLNHEKYPACWASFYEKGQTHVIRMWKDLETAVGNTNYTFLAAGTNVATNKDGVITADIDCNSPNYIEFDEKGKIRAGMLPGGVMARFTEDGALTN